MELRDILLGASGLVKKIEKLPRLPFKNCKNPLSGGVALPVPGWEKIRKG